MKQAERLKIILIIVVFVMRIKVHTVDYWHLSNGKMEDMHMRDRETKTINEKAK